MSDDLEKGTCDFELRLHAPQDNCRGWEPTKAKEVVGDLAARNKTLVNSIANYKKRNAALGREIESLRGAPVEPVPAPEIVKLRHVIEEARAIAWDLYENPWEIPDAARDEISDLHNLLARAIDRSAPVPAPRLEWATDEHYWGGSKTAEYAWADVPQDLHWMADGHRLCLFDNEYDRAWCVSSVEGRTHEGTKALAESLAAVLAATPKADNG